MSNKDFSELVGKVIVISHEKTLCFFTAQISGEYVTFVTKDNFDVKIRYEKETLTVSVGNSQLFFEECKVDLTLLAKDFDSPVPPIENLMTLEEFEKWLTN